MILGIAEVTAIGELHARLGLYQLIGLYVATTGVGAIFLFLQYPAFKKSMKAMEKAEKGFKKAMKVSTDGKYTNEQLEKMRPMFFISIYGPAFILVAIPGIVSDVIGTLMVIPFVSNMLLNRSMNNVIENVAASFNKSF